MFKNKWFAVILLAIMPLFVTGCVSSLTDGEKRDTASIEQVIEIIKLTHASEKLKLEAIVGTVDLDGDGKPSAAEVDSALARATAMALVDEEAAEAMAVLAEDRRFWIWAGAVLGELVLEELSEDELDEIEEDADQE